jgi:septum site-determining protein MinC
MRSDPVGRLNKKLMSENHATPVEIKISTVVAVCALMRSVSIDELEGALKRLTGGAPDYFAQEFAVIDVAACDFTEQLPDWPALISLFKSYGLNPVAVRHAPAEMEADILAQGLSIDVVARAPVQPVEVPVTVAAAPSPEPEQAAAPLAQAAAPLPALIIDTPVRAGQRIYARGRDLIVTAAVNSGAELIADGSIHVYASLRGRALAGASGDGGARIFALGMEAELVSIAGTYRTFENGLPPGLAQKPAQVRLVDDRLDVSPLTQFRA